MAYGIESYRAVRELLGTGISDHEIASRTGVSRATVRNWRIADSPPQPVLRSESARRWRVEHAAPYCYLLGAYLGDGTVWSQKGLWLQIVNDRRYLGISEEIIAAMAVTFPGRPPRKHRSSCGESDVLCVSHPALIRAFPQHGPGRKHLRPITLEDWQLELTWAHPGALIRGLKFRTKLPSGRIASYSYVRYFFSNLSADIRQIFIDHCQLLGIRVTQSNHRNLTVSHRNSVAVLEELVGPKT